MWIAAFLATRTSFLIGARLGRSFLERHGPRVKITARAPRARSRATSSKHGGKTILIGRFIGLVRALAPFIAGSSKMPYRRFAPYSVIGTGLWAATFVLLGYFFWQSFEQVAEIAGPRDARVRDPRRAHRRRRLRVPAAARRGGARAGSAAWLERQGQRPLLRPLAAVLRPVWRRVLRPAWRFLAPQLRFLWERLTPGGLGIELTTTLAVASVGGFVFGAYADELPRPAADARATRRSRPRERPRERHGRRHREGRDRPRVARRCRAARRDRRGAADLAQARCSSWRSRQRLRADLRGRPPHEGGDRPAAARRSRWTRSRARPSRAGTPPTRPRTWRWP